MHLDTGTHGHSGFPQAPQLSEWMLLALEQAERALSLGEAPIGCVLLRADGSTLSAGINTMMASGNLIAHAEINAFASAAGKTTDGEELILVSSLEPCVMCTGAAMQAGVVTIVYALQAPADAGTSRVTPPQSPGATMPLIIGNVLADGSRKLFATWMELHDGDASRSVQRSFVQQLLALTASQRAQPKVATASG